MKDPELFDLRAGAQIKIYWFEGRVEFIHDIQLLDRSHARALELIDETRSVLLPLFLEPVSSELRAKVIEALTSSGLIEKDRERD